MAEFTIKQIEDYLNGVLANSEREALEREMAENADFQQRVDDHQLIFEGLKGMEMDVFRGKVGEWESEIGEEESPKEKGPDKMQRKIGSKLWIALAVLALLMAALFYHFSNQKPAQEELQPEKIQKIYVDNGKMEQVLIQPFQNLASSDAKINELLDFLNTKDYESAINLINQIDPNDKNFVRLKLLKGLCLLNQENYSQALNQFQEVIATDQANPYLKEEAEWLEIITLTIPKGNKENDLKLKLNNIKRSADHKYQEEAALLLENL